MKTITTIPHVASSLRIVALNKKNIESDIREETDPKNNTPKDIRKREQKPAEQKKKPESFEYRIKEKKHDPL